MAGLIWKALGKAVSDTGTMYAQMGMRDYEARQAEERAIRAEERKDARTEARDEALKQRVAKETLEVGARADDVAAQRRAKVLEEIARENGEVSAAAEKVVENNSQQGVIKNTKTGKTAQASPSASQAEIEALIKANPQAQGLYEEAGLINKSMMRDPATAKERDPRLQRAEDEASAALQIGASATVLEAFAKKKTAVLSEIAEENRGRKADQQHATTMAAINERGRQFDERKPILQQQADAATARATRPPGGSGGGGASGESITLRGLQVEATAASRAVDAARKTVDTLQKSGAYTSEGKAALADARAKLAAAEAQASAVQSAISRFNSGRSDGANSPKPGDNGNVIRPPLSSFAR